MVVQVFSRFKGARGVPGGCQGVHMWLCVANVASMVAGPVYGPCHIQMQLDIGAYIFLYRCI